MRVKVKVCNSGSELEKFLNGIDVDNNLIQITHSSYASGYTHYCEYTVIYKSRW